MRIVTNYDKLPPRWRAANGIAGETVIARTLADFRGAGTGKDTVFLVNCDPGLLMRLAAAKSLVPGLGHPLVASDLVLRRPKGLKRRLATWAKGLLLSRADLYLNFFADASGLARTYGIPPERCLYIPFKVNLDPQETARTPRSEDYALCFGRSLRDFDTFFAAMARLPYAGAIAAVNPAELAGHGARFTLPLDRLPANVRQLPDDGSARAQLHMLAGAKLVVIPVLKESIVASGISTALNAMQMEKCIIGSEGPGMSDIFTDEVLCVPPEDPDALAAMIARAWEDDGLRTRTAAAGHRFALRAGGEGELVQRILDAIAGRFGAPA